MSAGRALLAALLVLALGAGGAALWVRDQLRPVRDGAPERLFTVAPGQPLAAIAADRWRRRMRQTRVAGTEPGRV